MQLSTKTELTISTLISQKLTAYAAFFKLRLSFLVVFSAILGFLIASSTIIWLDLFLLVIGGFLVTGSSNGFNQIIERELDAKMDRTKNRPLVTGSMNVTEAIAIASISGFIGVVMLWVGLNPLSGVLGLLSLFVYVAIYTPLKRITPWAVFVGAFPGAIPPMLGWVAVNGHFGLEPGLLFAVQFMWQFPHFWAIAWKAHDDYGKAGFHLLPSSGGKDLTSAFMILLYSLFLLLVSMLPFLFKLTGVVSAIIFVIAGLAMIYPSIKLFKEKSDKAATKVMLTSFIYVPIILLAWYFDKI
jgi:protoheme IX farnesyltransferase